MNKNRKSPPWSRRIFLLLIFTLLFGMQLSSATAATTWYVNDGGTGDGTTWALAYGDITAAVTASSTGDEIWIKEGTYAITAPIVVDKAVTLYGGFPDTPTPGMGDRDPSTNASIVDGGGTAGHCLDLDGGGVTLDGLEITGGNHTTASSYGGGGIFIMSSHNNTIRNCRIHNNTTSYRGGGILIWTSNGTTIENCTFESNSSGDYAGALWVYGNNTTITNSTFTGNHTTGTFGFGGAIYANNATPLSIAGSTFTSNYAIARGGAVYMSGTDYLISTSQFTTNHVNGTSTHHGGAIATVGGEGEISDCSFTGNHSTTSNSEAMGGAIYLGDAPTVKNCSFTSNYVHETGTGKAYGGAIYIHHFSTSEPLITQCTFKENKSQSEGGAISVRRGTPTIENCLFTGNAALMYGGAVSTVDQSGVLGNAQINNCTITENYAGSGGAIFHDGDTLQITNSTIWNNLGYSSDTSIRNRGLSILINYTDIESYSLSGIGNLASDPLFVTNGTYDHNNTNWTLDDDSWTEGDYHLQAASPCIDIGTVTDMPLVDLEDTVRPQGTYHDLGVYEVSNSTTVYTLTASVTGGNGSISPESGRYYAADNDTAALTASPDQHYHLDAWTGTDDDSSTAETNSVAMDSDATVTVSFAITTYTLTYLTDGNGSITGTTPQTVDSGSAGTQVTATPASGYHFVNWSDSSTQNPRTDTNVTADKTVTANFAINTYTLTYIPGANGSITGNSPQNVAHASTGTAVAAVADTDYHFVNWSDGSPENPRTDTNVTADITVTANFSINTYTLTYIPGANGFITGTTPQTVDHGSDGTAVTAVAVTGYHFVDWDDGSTDNPRTDINIISDLTFTASFSNQYTLSVVLGGTGSGIVTSNPAGIDDCTTDCSADFLDGTNVNLAAVTDKGSRFMGWSGDVADACPETGECIVTMNQARGITATFNISDFPWTMFMPAIIGGKPE